MIEKIGFWTIMVCGGLVYASEYFNLPWLGNLGVILLGLAVIVGGIRVFLRGEFTMVNRERRRYEHFFGIPSRLWGVILVMAGCIFIILSWIDLTHPGGAGTFWDSFLNSPFGWGILLGMVGLLVVSGGIIRLMAGSAADPEQVGRLEEFGFHFGGLIQSIVGVFLILLALGLIFIPDVLKSLFDRVVGVITE